MDVRGGLPAVGEAPGARDVIDQRIDLRVAGLRGRPARGSRRGAGGWDIEEVSARLGHSSVATTQRIYVHQFDAARRSEERRCRLARLYPGAPGQVLGA